MSWPQRYPNASSTLMSSNVWPMPTISLPPFFAPLAEERASALPGPSSAPPPTSSAPAAPRFSSSSRVSPRGLSSCVILLGSFLVSVPETIPGSSLTSVDASSAVTASVDDASPRRSGQGCHRADKVDDDAPHVLLPAVRAASFGKEVEAGLDVRTALEVGHYICDAQNE